MENVRKLWVPTIVPTLTKGPIQVQIFAWCRQVIEEAYLEPESVVIAIRAHGYRKVNLMSPVAAVLDVEVDNLEEPMGWGYICPSQEIVKPIWEWWKEWRRKTKRLIVQCESGIDRAQAVAAAIVKFEGGDPNLFLHNGTYNRLLYKEMLTAANMKLPVEKQVSIMVVPQWPVDRLEAFFLCLKRQRYDNWQLVICTDGPRTDIEEWVNCLSGKWAKQVKLVQTPEHNGHFGHAVRQLGIDSCDGEVIGLNGIDNYLTPGYIEQLMWAIDSGADMAFCDTVHNYTAYDVNYSELRVLGCDMGCFLAKASLIRQVPWPGTEIMADGQFVEALAEKAGEIVRVNRPLYVHN